MVELGLRSFYVANILLKRKSPIKSISSISFFHSFPVSFFLIGFRSWTLRICLPWILVVSHFFHFEQRFEICRFYFLNGSLLVWKIRFFVLFVFLQIFGVWRVGLWRTGLWRSRIFLLMSFLIWVFGDLPRPISAFVFGFGNSVTLELSFISKLFLSHIDVSSTLCYPWLSFIFLF